LRVQTNKVVEELRRRIHDGVFRPAESLTEVTLAAEFGVSRNTIKKALLKLESENLIVMQENRRACVRCVSVDEAMQYLEVRELLECFIIRQSVPFLGDDDLKEMSIALADMRSALDVNDFSECSQSNRRFYDVVYRVCPNRPAVEMVKMIKNQLTRYNIKTVLIPGRGRASSEEHRRICDAIKKKDAEMAEKLMHEHMVNMRNVLSENFQLFM
jgi:DNA-binding GntR family transcriptional regulator